MSKEELRIVIFELAWKNTAIDNLLREQEVSDDNLKHYLAGYNKALVDLYKKFFDRNRLEFIKDFCEYRKEARKHVDEL